MNIGRGRGTDGPTERPSGVTAQPADLSPSGHRIGLLRSGAPLLILLAAFALRIFRLGGPSLGYSSPQTARTSVE